jgi:hypothetical protein
LALQIRSTSGNRKRVRESESLQALRSDYRRRNQLGNGLSIINGMQLSRFDNLHGVPAGGWVNCGVNPHSIRDTRHSFLSQPLIAAMSADPGSCMSTEQYSPYSAPTADAFQRPARTYRNTIGRILMVVGSFLTFIAILNCYPALKNLAVTFYDSTLHPLIRSYAYTHFASVAITFVAGVSFVLLGRFIRAPKLRLKPIVITLSVGISIAGAFSTLL